MSGLSDEARAQALEIAMDLKNDLNIESFQPADEPAMGIGGPDSLQPMTIEPIEAAPVEVAPSQEMAAPEME